MTDEKPRRSRTAWPGPLSTAGVPPQHTHELPRALRRSYRLLLVAVVALLLAVGLLTYYVYQQEQYIQGKGAERDAENTRLHEQIRQSMCDLLDQLPQGGLLDGPRDKYGCGPGIPLSQLPPAIRDRYAPATAPPQSLTPLPVPLPGGASPGAPRPAPGTLPPRTGPGPGGPTPTPPSPDPTPAPIPLQPVTQPVCDLTGLCF